MTVLWIAGGLIAGMALGYWLRHRLMWKPCPRCDGKGYLVMKSGNALTCANCLGTGKVPRRT